ncbi:pentapeptide repeat-containing protein [Nostoc flagelliforme FACHB-838]|uniref:Pentapeptide repeat-containing protein n=1 Tax=Nostoc flagelliforme FACHB-838 TaxID=2692904 RepID=A0ABR8E360_9NOSO|nr:pentapeptide repeat-containing protein [Nostoc flagelliforme]MBD2535527.1 pentapeptide repeat-containing protein [Nostoc flagelliforme FACHB-838]
MFISAMLNEEHNAWLKKGVQAWNEWKLKKSGIITDLSKANLMGADLGEANLMGADLRWANLSRPLAKVLFARGRKG